jgi:uncharacterized delta-60 repeat protein
MLNFLSRKNGPSTKAHKPPSRFRPRLEALEDRFVPSGGVLDPTFGSGGIVSTTARGLLNAYAVATYPNAGSADDGKVVAVGYASVTLRNGTSVVEFAAARFNLNGTLDTSFGGTGEVTTILTTVSAGGRARDVAIQPDGKVVVAGEAFPGSFALVRYNANGSLDTSFGGKGTGIVLTNIGKNTNDHAYSVGLQTDGKIVVAGATGSNLALLRYTSSGALDSSFGTGGKVTTAFAVDFGCGCVNWIDLGLDTSSLDPNAGKIVVVAREPATGLPTLVARYTGNGSLDTSFAGGAGYDSLSNLKIPSVAIQSNGAIVVAGNPSGGMGLDRLNPDGSFDTTFGSGGVVVVSPPANTSYSARDVTIQSNGQIVVAGFYSATTQSFLVARFNSADGSLDTSFGTSGIASSGSSAAGTVAVALEPDSRIVVAGTIPPYPSGFTLARFLSTVPQITSLSANPNPVTAGSSVTLTASNIIDPSPNSTITQVAFTVQSNGTNTLLGYGTQTSTGTWTLKFTVNLAPGTYTLSAQAEDSYGILGDLMSLTLTVQ